MNTIHNHRRRQRTNRRVSRLAGVRRLFAENLERRLLLTTVTSVDPPENSIGAPVSVDVSATFDMDVNVASATAENFALKSKASMPKSRAITLDAVPLSARRWPSLIDEGPICWRGRSAAMCSWFLVEGS